MFGGEEEEEEEEKLQQATQERSSAVPAASSEGKRDLFYPKAQSAPFPQGMVARSGWRRSVLTLTVWPPSPLDVVVVGGGKPIHSHRLFLFFPEATIIFDYSFPFLQNMESFLGWKEELDTFLSILGGRKLCRGEIMTMSVPFTHPINGGCV